MCKCTRQSRGPRISNFGLAEQSWSGGGRVVCVRTGVWVWVGTCSGVRLVSQSQCVRGWVCVGLVAMIEGEKRPMPIMEGLRMTGGWGTSRLCNFVQRSFAHGPKSQSHQVPKSPSHLVTSWSCTSVGKPQTRNVWTRPTVFDGWPLEDNPLERDAIGGINGGWGRECTVWGTANILGPPGPQPLVAFLLSVSPNID